VWGLHVAGSGYRVRYEGTNAESGVIGSPNIVLEIMFEAGGDIVVDVVQNAGVLSPAKVGLSDGVRWILDSAGFASLRSNRSYRISGLV
jgi:hypothetical protein